jgi:hypothetical protein
MRLSFSRRAAVVAVAATTALLAVAFSAAGTASTGIRHGLMKGPSARNHRITGSTSSNWSGYAVTGGRYTSVSASWTQPAVTCSASTAYSSFWVGLDGDTTGTVEQTGTEADCSSGSPVYSSWYEMYPKFPVNYSNPVKPGDAFTASVMTNGSGSFTLTLSDATQHWSHTTSARLKSAKLGSAEVIAEAPSSSGGVLPLADFGTVYFSNATANGAPLGSLSGLDPITMASGGITKAVPNNISGGSFSVAWKHS